MIRFEAVLQRDATGPGTFIRVPHDVQQKLGLKGRPKINSVIAGHPYRGSLMPMGNGTFCLGVGNEILRSAGVARGDMITVDLEIDTAPRIVEPPPDLARAIARDKKAMAAWEKLSYTNKKEMARSVEEAKRPETRQRRLAAAMEKLRGR